jgi:CRISPR-associated protein Cmr4
MTTNFKAYLIQCITNLHVGSGDANYGIIDKMVQRDSVTDYPTIHASSLKGALREHFEKKWEKGSNQVNSIFGKETGENDSGSHIFLNADLVAIPIRCTQKQFVLSFDKKLADFINTKTSNIVGKKIFSLNIDEKNDKLYGAQGNNFYAEDYSLSGITYENPFCFDQTLIKNQFATFKTDHFENLVKNLPVIARNKVGENKNLWYEEIVPHQSIFLTFIGTSKVESDFDEALTSELIQIGANASVGYGLCKFHEIKFQQL